jgi:hypothetical protein
MAGGLLSLPLLAGQLAVEHPPLDIGVHDSWVPGLPLALCRGVRDDVIREGRLLVEPVVTRWPGMESGRLEARDTAGAVTVDIYVGRAAVLADLPASPPQQRPARRTAGDGIPSALAAVVEWLLTDDARSHSGHGAIPLLWRIVP